MSLIKIERHCAELSQYFGTLSDYQGYEGAEHVASWLTLAACLREVEYDIAEFDTGTGVCGFADLWAEKQGSLQKKLVQSIARFSFCWAALETMVDLLLPKSFSKKKGKINNLCEFLKVNYSKYDILEGYDESLLLLNKYASESLSKNQLRKPDSLSEPLSKSGVGIYRVYHLRNLLAHGAFIIPASNDDAEEPELELIVISTKIVLLTIQMAAIAKYGEENLDVFWKNHISVVVNTNDFLQCIHTDSIAYLMKAEEL